LKLRKKPERILLTSLVTRFNFEIALSSGKMRKDPADIPGHEVVADDDGQPLLVDDVLVLGHRDPASLLVT
jgi:hypothetical protein